MKIFINSSFCCPVETWSQFLIFNFLWFRTQGIGISIYTQGIGAHEANSSALKTSIKRSLFEGYLKSSSSELSNGRSQFGASSCAGIETFNQSLLGRAFWINWYSQDYLLLLPKWMVWMYLFFSCLDLFLGGPPFPLLDLNWTGRVQKREALRKTTHLAIWRFAELNRETVDGEH